MDFRTTAVDVWTGGTCVLAVTLLVVSLERGRAHSSGRSFLHAILELQHQLHIESLRVAIMRSRPMGGMKYRPNQNPKPQPSLKS